jgi:hypothetical protein
MTAPQTTSASYEVGYRKPPRHTQFQTGQSGNPGGRPRRTAERLEELALYEAYRTTVVVEDGHAMPMPAIQAVLRSQLQSAADGNVRAQRDILAMIRDIERIRSIAALFESGGADDDEPGRQQADGIDTYGERRQVEPEPAAPPVAGASPPEDAATSPAGQEPSPPSGSGSGQRRGVLPRRNGPRQSADVQPARPQPGRRLRGAAVNAGKMRGEHSESSRRSPRRTPAGPGLAQTTAGQLACRPPLPSETKN